MVPIIGMAGFYLLPLCTTAFWIYLGKQYARKWKTLPAVLIAHIVGGRSLLVYLWQFLLETDKTRNTTLAVFSQMFSATTPLYLFGGIARMVESQPNYTGRAMLVAMQVIVLVYMMICPELIERLLSDNRLIFQYFPDQRKTPVSSKD